MGGDKNLVVVESTWGGGDQQIFGWWGGLSPNHPAGKTLPYSNSYLLIIAVSSLYREKGSQIIRLSLIS